MCLKTYFYRFFQTCFSYVANNFLKGNVCPVGAYCPSGTGVPKPCSPGTYMNHTQASVCYVCPERYYCINRVNPQICRPGTFISTTSRS